TTYLEVYYNITSRELIETNAISTTCLKDEDTATVIDCESDVVSSSPVFVNNCSEDTDITHPQEMNTVTRGKISKTIEAQKEVFDCTLNDQTTKKVDIVVFTSITEDLNTQTTFPVQFLTARCVVVETDNDGPLQDAHVETCLFDPIEN
ncbi:MAG: hypothetical protein ACRD5H_14760, partial [Nitrososphaerales archaeon]